MFRRPEGWSKPAYVYPTRAVGGRKFQYVHRDLHMFEISLVERNRYIPEGMIVKRAIAVTTPKFVQTQGANAEPQNPALEIGRVVDPYDLVRNTEAASPKLPDKFEHARHYPTQSAPVK